MLRGSGSGKTTLPRCINLVERYDGGSVRLDGVEVGYRDGSRRPRRERELPRVGLGDKIDALRYELSGGQQQRVGIARAVALAPKLLLLDEITSASDPELVGEVLTVVHQLAREGMTMILVTHGMSFARDVARRVVFMDAGRVAVEGTPG